MSKLLIISLDAVPCSVWKNELMSRPNTASFAAGAETVLGVRSVFPSNTYPAHCSVVTGLSPCDHEVIGNTEPFPGAHPRWITESTAIKGKALWQATADAGLRVATVFWPCTGGSKHIRYNIPETHPQPGQNQITENLRQGSVFLQLNMLARYGRMLNGASEPALDEFITSCASYILKRKKPDLCLVHLYHLDMFGHLYGSDPEKISLACDSLDKNIGLLLKAAGEDCQAILFSDHAQLPVHTELTLNDILVDMGMLKKEGGVYAKGTHSCFIECCGGCAFFHAGSLPDRDVSLVRDKIAEVEGFSYFLSTDEMHESGRSALPFGFAMKGGYAAVGHPEGHKGNHGYPPDIEDYDVFYAVRGERYTPGKTRQGGSLLDIAPIAASLLGIRIKED